MPQANTAHAFRTYWLIYRNDDTTVPMPVGEYKFHPVREWRFDWAFPEYWVAVEIDGGQYKPGGGRHNRDSDRDKLNHAAVLGWRVFRFSPQMLMSDPIACMELVAAALGIRKPDAL